MQEEELSIKARLSCQRALLGAITPNIRMITIGWNDCSYFHLRAYFSATPTEMEIDDLNTVSAEVLADIPFEMDKVECIYDLRTKEDLEILKYAIYARKE